MHFVVGVGVMVGEVDCVDEVDVGIAQGVVEFLRVAEAAEGDVFLVFERFGVGGCLLYTSPSPRDRG